MLATQRYGSIDEPSRILTSPITTIMIGILELWRHCVGLRVFTSKWLGDDVRVVFHECGPDPDHSAIMTEYGLKPGDRPGTDLYPRVWERSGS